MMRVLRLFLATALLLAGHSALADSPDCPPAPSAPTGEQFASMASAAHDRGYLWKITRDGHSSWLYGTIHVGRPSWLVPGPHIAQAIRSADRLAFELDVQDPLILQQLSEGITDLQTHSPVRTSSLPTPLATRMRRQAELACMDLAQVEGMAPELVIVGLTSALARRDGLEPAFGIDIALNALGHAMHKTVVSLETVDQQLALLHMDRIEDTRAMVEADLEMIENGRAANQLLKIAADWEASDYDRMEHFSEWCECMDTPIERAMMKRMLDDRNALMAARIDTQHQAGHALFTAVGSLHLFGPQGLPTLLAARGYQVERVRFD